MLSFAAFANAQGTLSVDSIKLARNGGRVQLIMDVSIGREHLHSADIMVITPRLVGENDSVDFPQVVAYGRNAYYHVARQGTNPVDIGGDAYRIRYKNGPRTEHYARTIGHQPWMENSTLKLIFSRGTPCDGDPFCEFSRNGFQTPAPDTIFVERKAPEVADLSGTVSGQARIRFIVNRTEFHPELWGNQAEVDSMHRSILSVQQNPDVRTTRLRIKGYASPEGPYDNNVRLAKGRTERLREFIVDQWKLPQDQVDISFQPEDWEGFRRYMVIHHDEFPDADAILKLIDRDDPDLDHKLWLIQLKHPKSYKRILAECFPPLRRTDYDIEYEWLRQPGSDGAGGARDTVITPRPPKDDDPLEPNVFTLYTPTRPWMALKTNMLLDLALAPNIEVEFPLGRDSRWSVMVEDWFPWFLFSHNRAGDSNKYRRGSHRPFRKAYEVWVLGAELRYWFLPACVYSRPTLQGTFVGFYAAGGKYDWEWHASRGDQGEFTSLGLTVGHSWVLARKLNLELSASAGYLAGPKRHYVAEEQFQDNRLIWRYNGKLRYWGPTKLKLSLVWLFSGRQTEKKGGRL